MATVTDSSSKDSVTTCKIDEKKEDESFVSEEAILAVKNGSESIKDRITICYGENKDGKALKVRHFRNNIDSLKVQNIAIVFNSFSKLNPNCLLAVRSPIDDNFVKQHEIPGLYLVEKNIHIVELPQLLRQTTNEMYQWSFKNLDPKFVYYLRYYENSEKDKIGGNGICVRNKKEIDWNSVHSQVLSLDGGIGGKANESMYVAPNGTIVTTSETGTCICVFEL